MLNAFYILLSNPNDIFYLFSLILDVFDGSYNLYIYDKNNVVIEHRYFY